MKCGKVEQIIGIACNSVSIVLYMNAQLTFKTAKVVRWLHWPITFPSESRPFVVQPSVDQAPLPPEMHTWNKYVYNIDMHVDMLVCVMVKYIRTGYHDIFCMKVTK